MNWPFVLALIALVAFACIVIGKVFAAFGIVLLVVEAVALAGWAMTKITHDATTGGPPDDQEPHI